MKNIKRAAVFLLSSVMLPIGIVPATADEDDITIKEVYNATFDSFTSGTAAHNQFDSGLLKIENWYDDSSYFVDNPAEGTKPGDIVVRCTRRQKTYFSLAFNADKKEVKEELQNAEKLYLTTDVFFDDGFDDTTEVSWWTTPFNKNEGNIGKFKFDFAGNEIGANGLKIYRGGVNNKWHTIGLLVDNITKKVSYFYDNRPVAGAQNIRNAWNGSLKGMEKFLYAFWANPEKNGYMYFNNVAAYALPDILIESELGEDIELPGEITLKKQGENETAKVSWDMSGVDVGKEGEYTVSGTVAGIPIVLDAKVSVVDFIKREMNALSDKMDSKSATQEECLALYDKISEKEDYSNRDSYMAKINEYINGFSKDTVSQVPDLTEKVDAASKSITVNFDRLLQPWAEIILSDAAGENVPLKTEFTDKSVILKPQQKLETNEEYTILIKELSDKFGNILQQSPISFKTKIISVNIKDGEKYGYGKKLLWEENGKNVVTAKIIDEDGKEENAENGYTFTQTGAYEVILSADNGAEVEKFKITILEAFAPVASDVKITGKAETGETLTASYTFFDENNDEEKDSVYQWYRDNEAIDGATELTYTLTEEDEDKTIAFEVTPRADSEYESTGKSVRAEFLGACRPVAENVKINGKIEFGSELSASYEIHDRNGDEETDSAEGKWIFENEKGEKRDVGEGDKYTITENEQDGVLWFELTPKSKVKPYSGETVKTKIITPSRPKAENVEVKGDAKVGGILTGTYKWTDANYADGDREGLSEEHWVNASTGKIIADGAAIELGSSLKGENIYYEVIPKSVNAPMVGDAVRSKTFTVSGGSSSGGKGSGSSSGGGGSSVYIPPKTTEDDSGKDQPKSDNFKDIENHWAKDYINELHAKGTVKGIDSEHFAPDRAISRAEFITLIMRTRGIGEAQYNGDFSDVASDFWGAGFIAAALERGFIEKAQMFRPNDAIKREEAAKLISLITQDMPRESGEISFADSEKISAWAVDYIKDCAQKGLIKGDNGGNVNPQSKMTRAEAVTVIWRIIQNENTK